MNEIMYVTTNVDKFNKAQISLEPHGVSLVQEHLSMQEIQSTDGDVIVRDKVRQAYEHFHQPVLVNDDTWSIPALNGFPSTGMKLCNDFLVAGDWLRLMHGIEDRRIFLISYFAYHNGSSLRTMVGETKCYFLNQSQGQHHKSQCLQVIAKVGSKVSIAEEIAAQGEVGQKDAPFWKKMAEMLKN